MSDPGDSTSHAIYTRLVLSIYDFWVLGLSNWLVWKCPTRRLLEMYDKHVSDNHLDVGVGTGFFLDRCRFPTGSPRLALMDVNPNCLKRASRRVARYRPAVYRQNVLEPIRFDAPAFDSIAVHYLLHCLPGPLPGKSVLLDKLSLLLNPGGVIFGATILARGVSKGTAARLLMRLYNNRGIFSNATDDLAGLQRVLEQRLTDVDVATEGCVAMFSGRKR